jgi:hypothetical protein
MFVTKTFGYYIFFLRQPAAVAVAVSTAVAVLTAVTVLAAAAVVEENPTAAKTAVY